MTGHEGAIAVGCMLPRCPVSIAQVARVYSQHQSRNIRRSSHRSTNDALASMDTSLPGVIGFIVKGKRQGAAYAYNSEPKHLGNEVIRVIHMLSYDELKNLPAKIQHVSTIYPSDLALPFWKCV